MLSRRDCRVRLAPLGYSTRRRCWFDRPGRSPGGSKADPVGLGRACVAVVRLVLPHEADATVGPVAVRDARVRVALAGHGTRCRAVAWPPASRDPAWRKTQLAGNRMAGCESLDAAALNENAMSLPTKHGLIEVDAGCEGIVSGSIGVDEMGHANKKERVGGENSFHELRIYHNEELLCAQYREPIGSGRLTLLRLPGQEAAYEYDGGRVSSVTLRDLTEPGRPAATTSFGYNGSGLMAWVNGPRTDVNDHTWFQYDADGNVAERIDSLGHRYLFEYDDSGRLNTMTDPNGLRTQLAVDERESSGYVLAHGDTHALARSKIRMDGPEFRTHSKTRMAGRSTVDPKDGHDHCGHRGLGSKRLWATGRYVRTRTRSS